MDAIRSTTPSSPRPRKAVVLAVSISSLIGLGYACVAAAVLFAESEPVPPAAKARPKSSPVARQAARLAPPIAVASKTASTAPLTPASSAPPEGQRQETVESVSAPSPQAEVRLIWPTTDTRLTSTFGYRRNPLGGDGDQMHQGVDVPVPCGTDILAVEEGIIAFAEWTDGSGNTIRIAHEGGWMTHYAHLSALKVREGERVAAGQVIGFSGDTGRASTGPHLHFEIRKGRAPIDPLAFRFEEVSVPSRRLPRFGFCGGQVARASPVRSADRSPSIASRYQL